MGSVEFYWIFITGGVGLAAGVLGATVTQGFARSRAERRAEKARQSLIRGIGQEYRLNLFEALREFQHLVLDERGSVPADLQGGSALRPRHAVSLIPVDPRLHQAATNGLADVDQSGLAIIGFGYRELERHKAEIRDALAAGRLHYHQIKAGVHEVVEGLALLYLWRHHYGQDPRRLPGLRKADLLGYAREQGLDHYVFPGLHLFDMLVDYIRGFGMKVTPVPLRLTAAEYFARPPGDKERLKRHAARRTRRAQGAEREREARAAHTARKAQKVAEKAAREAAKAQTAGG